MSNKRKILVGIRDSKLSKAQTSIFIDEADKIDEIRTHYNFEIKTIKTTGDIHNTSRLDRMGGKGLFIKEIEKQIIDQKIDIGVHSMKDVPAQEIHKDLQIVCWMQRHFNDDALLSNSGNKFLDLPSGSKIGTSSIRRRAQILRLRKDLSVRLLRGNVDTRINQLRAKKYDAIILSLAGLQKLNLENNVTEVLSQDDFSPAACQGVVGIQARKENIFANLFKKINDLKTQTECKAERRVLKIINANCNSPISVVSKITNDQIQIKVQLLNHTGETIFFKTYNDSVNKYEHLTDAIGNEIMSEVGKKQIEQLNELEHDFDYTP
jgi:hydroxymethylbilane synthase